MSVSRPIRVLVVDDHPVVRQGLQAVIGDEPGMVVVGEAGNAREALALYRELRPDVVLLDLRLPDGDGVEVIRAIRSLAPQARVAVLSTYGDHEDIRGALAAGALGYLQKGAQRDDLLEAIRRVERGEKALPLDILERAVDAMGTEALTEREREILRLVAEGLQNPKIAERLGVSLATVKTHLHHILSKLGARDRTEALVLALQRGLVHIP